MSYIVRSISLHILNAASSSCFNINFHRIPMENWNWWIIPLWWRWRTKPEKCIHRSRHTNLANSYSLKLWDWENWRETHDQTHSKSKCFSFTWEKLNVNIVQQKLYHSRSIETPCQLLFWLFGILFDRIHFVHHYISVTEWRCFFSIYFLSLSFSMPKEIKAIR